MKKILAMVAIAISMPVMAQTMYDGKTCEQWKNEFEVEVATLKGELNTLKQKAKLDASTVTKSEIRTTEKGTGKPQGR